MTCPGLTADALGPSIESFNTNKSSSSSSTVLSGELLIRVRGKSSPCRMLLCVCVFIIAVPITKLFAWGGGERRWRTCATRDDEPANGVWGSRKAGGAESVSAALDPPFWTLVPNKTLSRSLFSSSSSSGSPCVCLLLQFLLQSCSRGGGGNNGGHVLRETTSRGLCVNDFLHVVYYGSTYYKAVRMGGGG